MPAAPPAALVVTSWQYRPHVSGSLRHKDGAWRLTYQADGRRHYATVQAPNNRTGRRAAGSALAQLIAEVDRGRHRGDPTTTFAELVEEWHAHQARNLEARTVEAYQDDLARALPHLGHIRLPKLRPHDLDRLYRHLQNQGLAAKTVRNVHGTISAVLSHAVRWEWIDANPAARASPPVAKRKPIIVPQPDQVLAVIRAARPDFAVYLRVAATTGHRRGTLLGLRWDDLDLDAGMVTFERAIAAAGGDLHVKGTKADRADTVTLGADVVTALRSHRAACVETTIAVPGLAFAEDGYVWAQDPTGRRPWHPGGVGVRWRTACQRAGVTGVRPHDLKHFAVTRMLAAGVAPWVVANRTGTGLPTILKVYAHWVPGQDGGAAEVMDRLLG